jgi:hypothetical protein
MPKFVPWADPPVGSQDRQHGTRGSQDEDYEIITQGRKDREDF